MANVKLSVDKHTDNRTDGPKPILGSKRNVHFKMLSISKISGHFFCKIGMVSRKYTIHRSNIKPMPCWAEIFALYGKT